MGIKEKPEWRSHSESKHNHGSHHIGEGPHDDAVRIRHPEFPEKKAPQVELINLLGGSTGEDGVLNLDIPCEPFADTKCYLLDDFHRPPVTGGSMTDGDPWDLPTPYFGEIKDYTSWDFGPSSREGQVLAFRIASSVGTRGPAWTGRPADSPCTGLAFHIEGWFEREAWNRYVVPEHPANAAGVKVTGMHLYAGLPSGAHAVVSATEPGGSGEGVQFALLPYGGGGHGDTVEGVIPISLVPAEGEYMWVGFRPAWKAFYGDVVCGWTWPWMNNAANSAKGNVNANRTITWQTYVVEDDVWGSGVSDDKTGAPWEGNLPWDLVSSGGTYGLDGDNLYLTATTSEQLVATMLGTSETWLNDDNDDPIGQPWDLRTGVNMKARFKVTTQGDTAEAGERFIKFAWHDGKDLIQGEVRLGDLLYAEGLRAWDGSGISVSADNFVAKAVSEGSYMWVSLDSRNPDYLRMKMWLEGSMREYGEPAGADLIVARADDTANPSRRDYFEITISAGNATGAAQTVQINQIQFCGSGDDCDWVTEYMGQGDGAKYKFEVSQQYKEGSLQWFVDGMKVTPAVIDVNKSQFRSPHSQPAAQHANMTALYRVDENTDGD